jgi:hypothetical protein
MNQDHPSPEDSGRLAEIEERLRQMRPRPVVLDIQAIVSAAHTVQESAVSPQQSVKQRGTHSFGWIAGIAGAWACGALAGALVTLLLIGRTTQPETPTNRTMAQNEPQSEESEPVEVDGSDAVERSVERDDSPPKPQSPRAYPESLLSIAWLDPYGSSDIPGGNDRFALSAGAFTLGRSRHGDFRHPVRSGSASPGVQEIPDTGSDAPHEAAADFVPDSPITRDILLQELLGARSESVL